MAAADVLITCPTTGKPTKTGMRMDQASFDSSSFENNQSRCAHCGRMHRWSKPDAYVGPTPTEGAVHG